MKFKILSDSQADAAWRFSPTRACVKSQWYSADNLPLEKLSDRDISLLEAQSQYTIRQVVEWLETRLKTGKGSLVNASKPRTFVVEFSDKEWQELKREAGLK